MSQLGINADDVPVFKLIADCVLLEPAVDLVNCINSLMLSPTLLGLMGESVVDHGQGDASDLDGTEEVVNVLNLADILRESGREAPFLGVVEIGWQLLPANAIHLLPHGIRIRRDIEFIPGKLMVFAVSLQKGQAYLMPQMRRRLIAGIHLGLTIPALDPLAACKRLENHAFNLPNMDRNLS